MTNTVLNLVLLAASIIIAGLMIYILGYAESAQEGFRKLFKHIGKAVVGIGRLIVKVVATVYRWGTEDETVVYQRDASLILSPEETTALIEKLSDHPYETPSLDGIAIDNSGIFSITVGAVGFAPRYRDLTQHQALQLTRRVVSEFLRENRGIIPPFYVAIATPYRFLLHIPLSQYGVETLKRRIEQEQVMRKITHEGSGRNHLNLQEEVDLSDMLDKKPEDKL